MKNYYIICFVVLFSFFGIFALLVYNTESEESKTQKWLQNGGQNCMIENIPKVKDSCAAYRLCEFKYGRVQRLSKKYCDSWD